MNSSISWIVMSSDLSLPQRIGRRIAQARLAARLKEALQQMSMAELARTTGWKESTLRDWIAAA